MKGNNIQIDMFTSHGKQFRCIGNKFLLKNSLTGFLCSRKCPAAKILESHEVCKDWASDPSKIIISSFHSPMEQECLRLLLQGCAGIVYFPAREIDHLSIRNEWRPPLKENRMLILTLESFKNRRMSHKETRQRNNMIADLAKLLYIPYANERGQLEQLLRAKNTAGSLRQGLLASNMSIDGETAVEQLRATYPDPHEEET